MQLSVYQTVRMQDDICIWHLPVEQEELKIRWDTKYKNNFRAGLIGKLPAFNLLTHAINISSKESVNNAIADYTNIVQSVADPLFSKHDSQKVNTCPCFNDASYASSADWFDLNICKRKNGIYASFKIWTLI